MTRPVLFFTLLVVSAASTPALAAGEDEWAARQLANGLDFPVDLAFGPDGTLYYAELATGNVRAIEPGADAPLADPVVHVDASPGGNGGFLGLALDPAFEDTGAFFVYYTLAKEGAENGKVNRVSRLAADGSETVLVDDIPWANMHDGGRLAFTGPDTLVVTTGDNEKRDPAQDPESLLGKTLRITRDGAPADGNPDADDILFTLGHRNPFGIAYDAANDVLWITENGPNSGDEVNVLEAGGNYGWPHALGKANDPKYVDPVVAFEKPIGPTGAAVLDGDLYFGDFNFGDVHRVHGDGSFTHEVVWRVPYSGGHVLDVEAGPDGRLYVSTYAEVYALTPPAWDGPPADADEDASDDADADDPGDASSSTDEPDGSNGDDAQVDDGAGDGGDGDATDDGGDGVDEPPVDARAESPAPAVWAALGALVVGAALLRRRA